VGVASEDEVNVEVDEHWVQQLCQLALEEKTRMISIHHIHQLSAAMEACTYSC